MGVGMDGGRRPGIGGRRTRLVDGSVPVVTRAEPAAEPLAGDGRNTPLPRWPLRRRPASPPVAADASDGLPPTAAPSVLTAEPGAASGEFYEDRRSARFAPVGSEARVSGVRNGVLSVSMTGIALQWSQGILPAVGTVLDADIRTGTPIGRLVLGVQIVRTEPARNIVAGRFVGLTGAVIDRLLAWLVLLEADAAE